jgi:hypothetical protein
LVNSLANLTSAEKRLAELRAYDVWPTFTNEQRILLRQLLEMVAANERGIAGQREWNKEVEEAGKYAAEFEKRQQDQIRAMDQQTESLIREIENYGKLPSEIAAVTLAKEEETLATLKLNRASEDLIVHQENIVKKQRQIVDLLKKKDGIKAMEDMARAWDSVAEAGGRFFADLVMNGKSAFDRLKDSLKSFAAELLALFAKRWILNMIAGPQAAALAGNGSLAGSVLNMLPAGAGALGMSALLGGAGGYFGAGALGAGERTSFPLR